MEDIDQEEGHIRTVSAIMPRIKPEFKQTYQLSNAGGDYLKTKLPKDFYEKIILGEMSVEYDFTIEKLTNLTDLYSLGIQYYLENNPVEAKAFQDRMGILLTNKDILANLKKQQNEEKKEKEKEKEKNNKDILINEEENKQNKENKKYALSSNLLPNAFNRKRAKTNFIVKSQNINSDAIQKEVSFVLKKDIDKEKTDKKNVKNLIDEELNKQNVKWKEKLKNKKINKKFQTPGPVTGRRIMALKSPVFVKTPSKDIHDTDLNHKNNTQKNKFNMLDDESSENDENEKNEGDIDFLKLFKEKHYSKEDDNIETFKIDDYQNVYNEKNDNKNEDSDNNSSASFHSDEYLKKIDEVDEEKEAMSLRSTAIKGAIVKKKSTRKKNESDLDNSMANNQRPESRPSIVDAKNVIKKIVLDDEIKGYVEERMKNLENIKNSSDNNTNNVIDDEISGDETSSEQLQDLKMTVEEIPIRFQDAYSEVEIMMNKYVNDLNNHFYKDTFEVFSLKLKDLYDKKFKKYIEVNNDYHNNIKSKEYQLEYDNSLNEEKKAQIQHIIDSLKEEQKDQIDKITDEYNELIDKTISDFKMTFYKKDCGINLMEEQLKLDIYTMINEAFY